MTESPLDSIRGRGEIVFLGSDLASDRCVSLLDTAYDDKVMSARIIRVAMLRGAYVDDRSKVTYNTITRGFNVTVWEWPRSAKRKTPKLTAQSSPGNGGETYSPDSIFEPYTYVMEET